MGNFSISEGESQGHPVFDITAKCGHSFQVFRRPGLTVSRFLEVYGDQEMCPECKSSAFEKTLDDIDYRMNPDTRALGFERIENAISFEQYEITIGEPEGTSSEDSAETEND